MPVEKLERNIHDTLRATVAPEDAIDFPCAPCWVTHYARQGLTRDYPPEFYRSSDSPSIHSDPTLPVPDPLHTIQEFYRFHHQDLGSLSIEEMQRELRQLTLIEDAHPWLEERVLKLKVALYEATPEEPESRGRTPESSHFSAPTRRKGIDL